MSFSVTFFGPSNYWWRSWSNFPGSEGRKVPRYWLHKPTKYSPGRIGFCIPGIHIDLTFGRERRKK